MNTAKNLALPATLAFGGVYLSGMIGVTNTWLRIGVGILGAGVGLAIAKHI
jgi:hypothetical protein